MFLGRAVSVTSGAVATAPTTVASASAAVNYGITAPSVAAIRARRAAAAAATSAVAVGGGLQLQLKRFASSSSSSLSSSPFLSSGRRHHRGLLAYGCMNTTSPLASASSSSFSPSPSSPVVIISRRGFASANLEEAAARLKTLSEEPDNDVKLKIYALFKQATVGDVNVPKPGAFDFVGKAKWAAWKGVEGTPKDRAEAEYISLVDQLLQADKEAGGGSGPVKMESGEGLVVTRENGVLTVRLNRPKRKNSLSLEMYKSLTSIVNSAANDPAVNYFVLTGTDDYFSSGNDLGNFTEKLKTGADLNVMAKDSAKLVLDYIAAFIDFPKPMVALVNGPAIGVSCTVLGLFDLIYASDDATFQTPFSQLGLSPEGCSSVTFPRLLGGPLAAEVLLMNRKLQASEAKQVGFVTDVFPAAQFEAECAKRIEYLSKQPPKSLMYSKMLLREPLKAELHKANIDECKRLEERFLSDEAMKAVANFFKSKGSKM